MTDYRPDIQALRGLAVLMVVLFHADIAWFKHGYLGVDVFFVISGYLITGQLASLMSDGRFSFASFYYRRAMRLLPAAYVVLIFCIAIAPFLLLDSQLADFTAQVIGALTFSANHVLLGQTGYFETTADHQPLLHFWSLSLEEQYYLLIPMLLLVFKMHQRRVVTAITVLSLVAYIGISQNYPEASFYLLPTRLWELGLGSILALSPKFQRWGQHTGWSSVLAIIAVLSVCLIPILWYASGLRGELAAVLICIATAAIIAVRHRWTNNGLIIGSLALLGAISYSVYLVHWPIFAFLHNANIQNGTWWPIRLTAVAVSIALGLALFRWVEQRYRITGRATKVTTPFATGLVALPLFLITLLIGQYWWLQQSNDLHRLDGVVGLSKKCHLTEALNSEECQSGPNPQILVWGDSYAQHLIPGLLQDSSGLTIAQATQSTCAPVLNLTLGDHGRFNRVWAKTCRDFNQATMSWVKTNDSITTVLLASQWSYLLEGKSWNFSQDEAVLQRLPLPATVHRMQETIDQLRAAGKKVVVVAPPPPPGFDAGKCVMRMHSDKLSFGGSTGCIIERSDNATLHTFLDQLEERRIAPSYRFEALLCTRQQCLSEVGNTLIYRDGGHLSAEGSIYLGELDNWPQRFVEMAY